MVIRRFHTDRLTVTVEAQEDHDLDLSWDETGDVRRDLERGELQHFGVKASVSYRGAEIASDYLGGCIYARPKDFEDHRECGKQNRELAAKGETGRCGSYFSDMVHNVCSEARKFLADTARFHVRSPK